VIVDNFPGRRILVVGDVMLDHFVRGDVRRVSPEAPALVLHVETDEWTIGGAGNVAVNIAALGGAAVLIGLTGVDPAARILEDLCSAAPGLDCRLVAEAGWPTIQKTRYVAGDRHLLRADRERVGLPAGAEARLIAAVQAHAAGCDAIILSDYSKGVLTDAVIAATVAEARRLGVPLIADPKRRGFEGYRGCTVLTPNRKELFEATGVEADTYDGVARGAALALEQFGGAILLTRSEQGVSLFRPEAPAVHAPARAQVVRDVSGAGDTIAAAFALALASGADMADAMMVANVAAGVAVSKSGTSSVSPEELTSALLSDYADDDRTAKLAARATAVAGCRAWAAQGLKVGFTNGCFDILHPGHVKLLRAARARCDRLVVGLNTDASVRRLKGPERPVQTERARADVISGLESVDMVVLFDGETPIDLIKAIRPAVLVKGADYRIDQVVGAEFVQSYGGRVELIDLEPGQSTTRLIERSRGTA